MECTKYITLKKSVKDTKLILSIYITKNSEHLSGVILCTWLLWQK